MIELTADIEFMNEIINILPGNIPAHGTLRRFSPVLNYQELISDINKTLNDLRGIKQSCESLSDPATLTDLSMASLKANINRFHKLTLKLCRFLTQYGGNQDKVKIIESFIQKHYEKIRGLQSDGLLKLKCQLEATTGNLQFFANRLGRRHVNGGTQSSSAAAESAFAPGRPAPAIARLPQTASRSASDTASQHDDDEALNHSDDNGHKRGSDSDDSPSKKQRPQRG